MTACTICGGPARRSGGRIRCPLGCEVSNQDMIGKPRARVRLEALVWKHTHKDFKGTSDTGVRTVLHLSARHGTTVTPITMLTDLQLQDKLPQKIREEIYGPDPVTPDARALRAAKLALELGHIPHKQGCSYECSRCGMSGSTPKNYITNNIDAPQGPIFTDRCGT